MTPLLIAALIGVSYAAWRYRKLWLGERIFAQALASAGEDMFVEIAELEARLEANQQPRDSLGRFGTKGKATRRQAQDLARKVARAKV